MNVEACLKQLDDLFQYKKLAEVEPFLLECVQQSLVENEPEATLVFLNELIGYYRSVSRDEDALMIGQRALLWVHDLGAENTLAHATTLINYATALRAAGKLNQALENYDQALAVLDLFPLEDVQYQKASLFNNMSLVYQAAGEDERAIDAILTALTLIEKPSVDQAISLVNLAGCYYRLNRGEEGFKISQKAVSLFLNLNETEDAHYAAALASLADGYAWQDDYNNAARVNEQAIQYQLDSFGQNQDYLALVEKQKVFLERCGRGIEIPGLIEATKPKTMTGLELSRAYYERYGKRALHEQFAEIADQLAIGLVGMGSECLKCDDEISQDHDFGPGFCIFVPASLSPLYLSKLQAFYEQLPKRFMGYTRKETSEGKGRVGVIVIEDFFNQMTGCPTGPKTKLDWLNVADSWLLMASNGEIFEDASGYFSGIWQNIRNYYPQDVYLKKLSKTLAEMARDGQYQYARCMARHDQNAAMLYLYQFIEASLQCLFMMNRQYMPYTKWQFQMAESLPIGKDILTGLKQLMKITEVDETIYQDQRMVQLADPRVRLIEEIAREVVKWLNETGLSQNEDPYLGTQAYLLKAKIQDHELRNTHILGETL